MSDSAGYFTLKGIKPGAYVLKTSSPAYASFSKKVQVKENEVTVITIQLEESVAELNPGIISAN